MMILTWVMKPMDHAPLIDCGMTGVCIDGDAEVREGGPAGGNTSDQSENLHGKSKASTGILEDEAGMQATQPKLPGMTNA